MFCRSVTTGVTNPDMSCYVLQNGALQPIAQAIAVPNVTERPPKAPSTRSQTPVAKTSSQTSDSESITNHQDTSKTTKRRDTHNR